MTDWSKITEPRADGADTTQIKTLVDAIVAAEKGSVTWPTKGALVNAEVRELDFTPKLADVVATTLTPEFIQETDSLLQGWPTYYTQLQQLLVAVYPVLRVGASPRSEVIGGSYGTRGSDIAQNFGQVYGTADTPHGLAECVVSSIGNWKLYTMGVKTSSWDNTLITNAPDQLVQAQVRATNEQKPIGAVLHAQYAILHILNWNLQLAQAGQTKWERWCAFSIKQHAARIQRGLDTLSVVAQTTTDGATVMTAICGWSTRLLEESKPWL